MDALFHEFLKELGEHSARATHRACADSYKALFAEAEHRRAEVASLEEQAWCGRGSNAATAC